MYEEVIILNFSVPWIPNHIFHSYFNIRLTRGYVFCSGTQEQTAMESRERMFTGHIEKTEESCWQIKLNVEVGGSLARE